MLGESTVIIHTNVDVSEAIKRMAWVARDLELLPTNVIERLFERSIERMTREDMEDLAAVAREINSILTIEAGKRTT